MEASASADITSLSLHRVPGLESAAMADMMSSNLDFMESAIVTELETITTATNADTGATDYTELVAMISALVDGSYSVGLDSLRMVVHPDGFAFLSGVYRSDADPMTGIDWLAAKLGGFGVSAHLSGGAASGRRAVVPIVRRGSVGGGLLWKVWDASELVVDRTSTGGRKLLATLTTTYAVDAVTDRRAEYIRPTIHTA